MFQFFSKELVEHLKASGNLPTRKASRYRLSFDGREYPVKSLSDDGLSMDATIAPHLRGYVDVYDGSRHILQCLIIASAYSGDDLVFSFKRSTQVVDQPALDYVRDPSAPIGYLPRL